MKAARYYGRRDVRVEDVEIPEIKDGQVLVEVAWCGIYGSDLHEYVAGPATIPTEQKPHPLAGAVLPVTMGHEFCGNVYRVSLTCTWLEPGQAVVVDPRIFCSHCHACQASATNICESWGFLGGQSYDGGGYYQFVAINENMCHKVPDSMLSEAALVEPLAVARHAVRSSGHSYYTKQSVLVLGGGPVGLALIFTLKAMGVGLLLISEPTSRRQNQTSHFVDRALDPRRVNVGEESRAMTAGKGVDIVFDCVGIATALNDGIGALRRGGTYVNIELWETEATQGSYPDASELIQCQCIVPMQHFMLKENVLRSSMGYSEKDFKDTVDDWMAGKFISFENFVTSRIALEDLVEKGLDELVNNKDKHVKILVTPQKELLSANNTSMVLAS